MHTQINLHGVQTVEVWPPTIGGGTEDCPHHYAHRELRITTADGTELRLSLFGVETEPVAIHLLEKE